MNKRSYPYGVDMCPQLKIHVGDKEVANGVLKSTKMQEVYGKQYIFITLFSFTYKTQYLMAVKVLIH